jgi:hypothetical protein
MKSYINGEITITAAQLASAKAAARKEMLAAIRSKGQLLLYDMFGFAFDHALEGTDIGLHYNDGEMLNCDDVGRLILGSVEESWALNDVERGIWKKWRLDDGDFETALLLFAVDELVAASFAHLGIKVKSARVKAAHKPAKERPRLRRVA